MFARTMPHPDLALETSTEHGATIYAYTANCPLYKTVRIISTRPLVGRRRSFWLSWDVDRQQLTNSKDSQVLPADILEWIKFVLADYFPDHATATGLSPAEVAELRAEQKRKREAHAVSQSGKNKLDMA